MQLINSEQIVASVRMKNRNNSAKRNKKIGLFLTAVFSSTVAHLSFINARDRCIEHMCCEIIVISKFHSIW